MLLAAFGERRPTKDIDFAALDLDNAADHVLAVLRGIAAGQPREDDGLIFDSGSATAEVIRDDDEYSGVRVSMGVELATARTRFHIDINVGDPVWPAPGQVEVISRVGVPQYEDAPIGFGSLFGGNISLVGGPAPARAYIERLLPAVLDGSVRPGTVFDRTVGLDAVADGYAAMAARDALKVLVRL